MCQMEQILDQMRTLISLPDSGNKLSGQLLNVEQLDDECSQFGNRNMANLLVVARFILY